MSRTTTQPDAQILALVAAQAQIRAQYTAQAVALAAAAAASFHGWYDSAAITVWAEKLAQRIEALQRAAAQNVDAYLARVLSLMTGSRVRPIGRVDVTALRQGITHAGAYGRAADAYRWQQAEFDRFTRDLLTAATPTPFDLVNPVDAAVERVKAVADMDVQLADRAQTQAIYSDAADRGVITGYRRVIHPEESRGGSCGLCVAASDRLYSAHEPKPIHARCHCTTLPVLDGADPGSLLNAADLRRLYKEAGGTHTAKLAGTRYKIDEHGELGPLLNPHDAKVRTARQVAKETERRAAPKTPAEKLADVRRIRDSLDAALPKARELATEDPGEWGPYLTKLEHRIAGLDHDLAA